MNTSKNDFCKYYQKKKENDKKIEEYNNRERERMKEKGYIPSFRCYTDKINIHLVVEEVSPGVYVKNNFDKRILTLDQEDLDILFKKYSALLAKELEDNIAELKKQYE